MFSNPYQAIKVLLIVPECNPEWSSVPLEGYQLYRELNEIVDVTLVTHARNEEALRRVHSDRRIVYIPESQFIKTYYRLAARLSTVNNRTIWPLYNTLTYPIYAEFNQTVYSHFSQAILQGKYDLVHALTPMMPRYPVKVVQVCGKTPFVLGPVNGGVPFPPGFQQVAWQEFSYFNFLRAVGRYLIPGYRVTYENADWIFAGSTYTFNLIQQLFKTRTGQMSLLYENGITDDFLKLQQEPSAVKVDGAPVQLLFVGRLVPYKGADMLVEALSKLQQPILEQVELTIVGDGSERNGLESLVHRLGLEARIHWAGWVPQGETLKYYRESDLFCFPSIREFGGAVVLEAMASGLPCLVVNNGGIGEYVTQSTGFKIEPLSRDYVIQELTRHIELLVQNPALRLQMSAQAIERAREFTWSAKAKAIVDVYAKLLQSQSAKC
jgi:glycosyltransferase involved in cell wall biosynthesis